MKQFYRILATLFFIVHLTSVFGQTSEYDTVFVKRMMGEGKVIIDTMLIPGGRSSTQVLAGTTFLPYSDKMIGLLNNGLSPINLEITDGCDNDADRFSFKDYPIFREIERSPNVLTINVSIIANCCHNFLGEAEVVGESTLNLVYTSYGGFCSCNCPFTLRYTFDTTFEENYQTIEFVTVNNSKTVGQVPKK